MAIEIERKFLLANDNWRALVSKSTHYRQGYLNSDENSSVRIRVSDDTAKINIKSATVGVQRHEYEYDIPAQDAHELLDSLCHKPLVEKIRHLVVIKQHTWEIDEFAAENQGLVVAEIELSQADEKFDKPDWVGEEVTEDVRYYNNQLARRPFKTW